MGLLFLLAAILGLVFPPIGVVVLAMMILGVFAKGVVAADSQEQIVSTRRKVRLRHGTEQPHYVIRQDVTAPGQGKIIDVRCYPILPPLRLTKPMPKPLDGPR